jgi:hypothetical protein
MKIMTFFKKMYFSHFSRLFFSLMSEQLCLIFRANKQVKVGDENLTFSKIVSSDRFVNFIAAKNLHSNFNLIFHVCNSFIVFIHQWHRQQHNMKIWRHLHQSCSIITKIATQTIY